MLTSSGRILIPEGQQGISQEHSRYIKLIINMIGDHRRALFHLIELSIAKHKIRTKELFTACANVLEKEKDQYYSWSSILEEVKALRAGGKTADPNDPYFRADVVDLLDYFHEKNVPENEVIDRAMEHIEINKDSQGLESLTVTLPNQIGE